MRLVAQSPQVNLFHPGKDLGPGIVIQEFRHCLTVDKSGNLSIFELKAWESFSENLLQILRYGLIYGAAKYAELDTWFKGGQTTNNPY
jgi:hypothetical protein